MTMFRDMRVVELSSPNWLQVNMFSLLILNIWVKLISESIHLPEWIDHKYSNQHKWRKKRYSIPHFSVYQEMKVLKLDLIWTVLMNQSHLTILLNSMVSVRFVSKLCKKPNIKLPWESTQSTLNYYFRKLRAAGLRTISQYDSHVSTDGQSGK